MSTSVAVAEATPAPAAPTRSSTGPVIARRAFRQLRTSAIVCALAFGLTVASSALTYASTFATESSRQQLAATTSHDTGLAVLLGPTSAIDTVGGYTVYKCFVFLTTIGALWALFAATRLLRGDEDTGRWELMVAGATRPARATAATLAGIGGAIAVVFAGTTALTFAANRHPGIDFGIGPTVLYGLSITVPIAVFAGVGAVTSQVGRARRVATGLGAAVLGAAFVIRMIADSSAGTRWLLWWTPFGWSQLMEPFTTNNAWPLVPPIVSVVLLVWLATALASRRDVGDGILATGDVAQPRHRGLGSTLGLVLRLESGVLIAWWLGVIAAAAALGVIANLTAGAPPSSMTDLLKKLGVEGAFVNQYLSVAFLLVAAVVAMLPAGQLGAAADEELSGRLVHVVTRPPRRRWWLSSRLGVAAVAVMVAGLASGVAAWAGATSQGVHLDFLSLVGTGLNTVPTALLALGIGAVVLSFAPRFAGPAVYAVIAWSFIVDLLSSLVTSLHWLDHLELFHYMALAPAQPVRVATVAVTCVLALALCVVAVAVFDRRDLSSD